MPSVFWISSAVIVPEPLNVLTAVSIVHHDYDIDFTIWLSIGREVVGDTLLTANTVIGSQSTLVLQNGFKILFEGSIRGFVRQHIGVTLFMET